MTAWLSALNDLSAYPLIALLGYVLGSSNMAIYHARLKGVDLKAGGTGNPGASNTLILLGWRAAVLVAVHDIGKAALAVWLAGRLFPDLPWAGVVAGVGCVLGHMYPFYTHFHGGKGFASYLGMTLALDWKLALAVLAAVVVLLLITDYIVVCTLTTAVSVPAYYAATGRFAAAAVLCVASAAIFWKHRENITRIRSGTEIGFRSAGRGEHRIKRKK